MGEWHWNMYNIICETSHQSRFDARYWMLGAGALGRPRGMVWGGRKEEGSGWGTRVYLWQIHVDIWKNQYNIVKLKKYNNKKNKCPLPDNYLFNSIFSQNESENVPFQFSEIFIRFLHLLSVFCGVLYLNSLIYI